MVISCVDFVSKGYLFAELLQSYGQDVNISKIRDSNKTSTKIKNFVALAPTFKVQSWRIREGIVHELSCRRGKNKPLNSISHKQ